MIRRAYEAIEECLADVVRTFPTSDTWRPLEGAIEDNGVLLAKIARRIGFADAPESPCFEQFLRIGSGPVKGVIYREHRELVALLAAVLLSARDRSEHPLRRCAAEFPEFILSLNGLKWMRDRSSHHTTDDLDREEALGYHKDTLSRCSAIVASSRRLGNRFAVFIRAHGMGCRFGLSPAGTRRLQRGIGEPFWDSHPRADPPCKMS